MLTHEKTFDLYFSWDIDHDNNCKIFTWMQMRWRDNTCNSFDFFLFYFAGVDVSDNDNLEEQIHQQLSKTEMSLTLTNKFEVPEDDQTDIKTLLIR